MREQIPATLQPLRLQVPRPRPQPQLLALALRLVLEQKLSHAYLFCGPRGTGKTTMARLLAKAILCHEAPGHLPDGTCEDCQLIAAGQHPDVFEIDAASNTGVDNVGEEIISRALSTPGLEAASISKTSGC